jgi:hypothetical protein
MQAVRIATLLAYASEFHHLDFQGWILDDSSNEGLNYFSEPEHFLSVANKAQPLHAVNHHKEKSINSALQDITQRTSKGALFYLISDLAGIEGSTTLSQLSEQCFIQAMHIVDPAEKKLPQAGKVRLQDLQSSKVHSVNTDEEKDCLSFSQATQNIINHRKSAITPLGILYTQVLTEVDDIKSQITLPLGQS